MKEQVQEDNNDEQKQGEIIGELKEEVEQRYTYQREQQVLQIDNMEGEAEKRQNGVRVEQEDEIKEGVK